MLRFFRYLDRIADVIAVSVCQAECNQLSSQRPKVFTVFAFGFEGFFSHGSINKHFAFGVVMEKAACPYHLIFVSCADT